MPAGGVPVGERLPRGSIALVSAAALAYEVLLTRLFAIIQWHHFAYMVISLALLGFGASGTVLALARRRLMGRFAAVYTSCLALFGVTTVACYLAVRRLPFNPEEMLWDPRQPLYLLLTYLLLAVPFFFAATGIGLALMRYADRAPRLYAADLLGAGVGGAGVVLLLFVAAPGDIVKVVGVLGVAAAVVGCRETGTRLQAVGPLLGGVAVVLLLLPSGWLRPEPSPYKGLSQLLEVSGARLAAERTGPLGVVSAVESPRVPVRDAPGLSLLSPVVPPEQVALFVDGDGPLVITRDTGERSALAYLDYLPVAAPYHLGRPQEVLVLGSGGGSGVLQARYHGARRVDAVERNPHVLALAREPYADFSGGVYDAEGVRVHVADARAFVATRADRYDLIQLDAQGGGGGAAAGLYALSEDYLHTTEAFGLYLDHLTPDGYLAVTRSLRLPPRSALKLAATAIAALTRQGVSDPAGHLILFRSLQTVTLLVKATPFTGAEVAALRRFLAARAFDPVHYPGMAAGEANHHNVLDRPLFYEGVRALLGEDAEGFTQRYKYAIAPATDDRPFFHQFFRWRTLPEIVALRERGGLPLLEWGYPVLVVTLAQAVLAGLFLILLPLGRLRKREAASASGSGYVRVVVYFSAIGLGFLFIEIALIQKFVLFLGHPLYAVGVVLAAFLAFAGLGSSLAGRLAARWGGRQVAMRAAAGVAVLAFMLATGVGVLAGAPMAWPAAVKIGMALLLIAPLGLLMGMPFPLAMVGLGRTAPGMVPWAWGINGCASVVSAVLATLIAVHLGFIALVLCAAALYGVAALTFPMSGGTAP